MHAQEINDSNNNFKHKKGFIIADIGLLVGTVANEMKAPLTYLMSYNYPVYKSFHLGLGSGLEFYQMTYVPVLGEVRYKPRETGLAVYFQGGYAIPINEKATMEQGEFKFKPGVLFNPGISYTFPTTHKAAFTISIGYRYQKNESERINDPNRNYYYREYQLINQMNRFNVRIGYTFM